MPREGLRLGVECEDPVLLPAIGAAGSGTGKAKVGEGSVLRGNRVSLGRHLVDKGKKAQKQRQLKCFIQTGEGSRVLTPAVRGSTQWSQYPGAGTEGSQNFPWFYGDSVHWEEAPVFEAENTGIST